MTERDGYDLLILGSGIAGLSLALRMPGSWRVAVVSKRALSEGATLYAQGGISAVLDATDSLASHVEDTLNAGAGLCHAEVVRYTVARGPAVVQRLIDQGVVFTGETRPDGSRDYHLTREGGHSHRRVIHAADATGREVETTLVGQARARANIDLFEDYVAVDLVTGDRAGRDARRCLGAYLLNTRRGQVESLRARFTALATGGAGKAYLYTSNPDVATGDGIAMSWRAGCRIANMEFVQFHPTCLFHPEAKSFLVTEAVRGEGGCLLLPDGSPFMEQFDDRAELAPRDVVARAIDHEMKRLGIECVYLDISHRPAEFVRSHFPTVYERCMEFGIDMTREPIPVVPAAHYTCGGVVADLRGRTDMPGLYALGEVTHSGLHGANRMASNSLLEGLVYAESVAKDLLRTTGEFDLPEPLPAWDESRVTDSDEEVVVSHNWDELRRFMWDYVGIVRTDKRLQRARNRVDLLAREIGEYYRDFRVSNDLIELRNLVQVSDLVIRSALARKESRGLHYTLDYPGLAVDGPADTVLVPPRYRAADDWSAR
jgi:L-aspartate oxidase